MSYVCSFPGFGKLVTIVAGFVTLVIGLHAHYQSAWVKHDFHKICVMERIHEHFYNDPCPALSMERFYVAIMLICFISSVIGYILCTVLINPYAPVFKIADLVYHFMASLFLLIAAIVYIISAVQIKNHPVIRGDRSASWIPPPFRVEETGIFLHTQKIIAGVLTMFLSLIYLCAAFAIKRGKSQNN